MMATLAFNELILEAKFGNDSFFKFYSSAIVKI